MNFKSHENNFLGMSIFHPLYNPQEGVSSQFQSYELHESLQLRMKQEEKKENTDINFSCKKQDVILFK